jgi:TetR/AcrR family transcriptional repressor of uid operon
MTRKRTEAPEIRRAQLLDAARTCFVRSGFASTKVADIAAEAGVSVGLVYRFFPSKEALVEAIIEADSQEQLGRLSQVLEDDPPTAADAIARFVATLRPTMLDRDRTALILEIAAEMMRNEKARSALQSQQCASKALSAKLDALSADGGNGDRFDLRLRLVNALASGAAIEMALIPELQSEPFLDLLERVVADILTG